MFWLYLILSILGYVLIGSLAFALFESFGADEEGNSLAASLWPLSLPIFIFFCAIPSWHESWKERKKAPKSKDKTPSPITILTEMCIVEALKPDVRFEETYEYRSRKCEVKNPKFVISCEYLISNESFQSRTSKLQSPPGFSIDLGEHEEKLIATAFAKIKSFDDRRKKIEAEEARQKAALDALTEWTRPEGESK